MSFRLLLAGVAWAACTGALYAAPAAEPSSGQPTGATLGATAQASDKPTTVRPFRKRAAAVAAGADAPDRPAGRRASRNATRLPPARPEPSAIQVASPPAAPEPSTNIFATLFGAVPAQPRGTQLPPLTGRNQIDTLVAHHAKLNGVPESLVHRIIVRESRYNPRAVGSGGAMGLMQIKTATARGMGYQGGPTGLLDAETNITYAVKYLAGAYKTAGGDHDRAVSHYARGYYYEARRQGLVQTASYGTRKSRQTAPQAEPQPQQAAPSFFSFLAPSGTPAQGRPDR